MPGPRKGLIRTFTGREFNPLNANPDDIVIEDIAHSLALCNRFAGHTKKPISVAQHSVYVSRLAARNGMMGELQGLLHDASEAYLGDITKWLKATPEFAAYRAAEEKLQRLIFKKFGCPLDIQWDVDEADRIMVRFEGMQGYGPDFTIDHPNYPPLTKDEIRIVGKWAPWSWNSAEDVFLATYRMCDNRIR